MEAKVKISVKNLIGFVLRGGSIDSRFTGVDRVAEGSRIHRQLQKIEGDGYLSEVTLRNATIYEEVEYIVEGRADGIFMDNELVTVDEIKTTAAPAYLITETFNWAHWAQGQCYAYFYCVQNKCEQAAVRLTYFQVDTEEIIRYTKNYTIQELEDFYLDLLKGYKKWATFTAGWEKTRNASIAKLPFPFVEYRKSQRELAVGVYKTAVQGGRFFCQAPTGIGKTVSTLFPAVKAMGEGQLEKIFYLTAKTITRTAAQTAVQLMGEKGLQIKSVTLTAKDKICFLDERNCNPDACPYANGYFDRVNDAVYQLLQQENTFTRQKIEQVALTHELCPFELSLDLSTWCDVIICDYNYLFDPEAHLRRFFAEGEGEYMFLVDEAHNLPDRAREMYSAALSKKSILQLKRLVGKSDRNFADALNKVNSALVALRKECEEIKQGYFAEEVLRKEFVLLLRRLLSRFEEYLERNKQALAEGVLETYFELRFFNKIAEQYDKNYITFYEASKNDVVVKLLCLDPAELLAQSFSKGKSAVLFSATFSPLPFYMEILGNEAASKKASFSSPFAQENLCLLIENTISTKYKDREYTLEAVAKSILAFASSKEGNYIVYFPSYKYMEQVKETFLELDTELEPIVQRSGSSEQEREEFLQLFEADEKNVLAFCVMGGVYAEGVDLVGERLSGCCIVGVGLPQINPQLELMRNYYDEKNNQGYAYAYRYPGMNKVLQAAGRVIRTPQDKGAVLLIDSRFTTKEYFSLFPSHWSHAENVNGAQEIKQKLEAFWQGEGLV